MIILPITHAMAFGILLILFGVGILIKAVIRIEFPTLKVFVGSSLILLGLSKLLDIRFAKDRKEKVFSISIEMDNEGRQ